MGYIKHDTIVVTHWEQKAIDAAREKAISLGLQASEVVASSTNGYKSFFVAPDGSKEGWDTSNSGDEARAAFIAYLETPSLWMDWVHVRYGGDDKDLARIEAHA